VVAETIALEIPPSNPGKTLIFAARDDHADTLVTKLKEALRNEYGDLPDDTVMKITGAVERTTIILCKLISDFQERRMNPTLFRVVERMARGH